MAREHVTRGETVMLLKRLLAQINDITAEGGDTTALRARYRAAGDAIVDGRFEDAKLLLTSPQTSSASSPRPGVLMKIDFVRRRSVRAGRA